MPPKKNAVRVVLIQPPLLNLVAAATPDYVDKNRGHNPPLGLLYIQAAIEKSHHESYFLDGNLEGWSHQETARRALSFDPGVIGIQAMTFTLPDVYLLAREIKKLNSDVKIVVGGSHATIYPRETATLEGIDFAFTGEGEARFPAFLDTFHDDLAWTTIPGMAGTINDDIFYSGDFQLSDDLDKFPYPARRSAPYNRYSSVLAVRNPITTMMTSRGCPFNCIFCNRMGRRYRDHSPQYVLGEIEDILKLGIGEIFIHDDMFTLDRQRVRAICEGIIERRYDVVWEARTRVDCVDEEIIALMRKAGCHRLSFGVESGSERVLKSMKKGIKLDQVERAFAWCSKEGIVTLADFMFGNLDEEIEDIKKSLTLAKCINPDFVQYSICSPYPDTPLYKLGLERGIIPRDIWLDFARNPLLSDFHSPVWTQHFSEEELTKLTSAAYKAFYMRPAFIVRQLKRINSFEQLKTILRGAIGMLRQ